MIFPFPQNWRTSLKPQTLSLANTVNTGVTFSTPSNAMENSKIWASAGFRGLGPTLTFPGAGMDGMGMMIPAPPHILPRTPAQRIVTRQARREFRQDVRQGRREVRQDLRQGLRGLDGCGCGGGGFNWLTAGLAVTALWLLHDNVWHAKRGFE